MRLAALAAGLGGLLALLVGAAPPAAAVPGTPSSGPVVLLAVPGLTWGDVQAMPHLAQVAARSAVGELSVKTRGGVTRCAAGLLAVSAGNRTTAPNPPMASCAIEMSTWPALRQQNHTSRYDAQIGALGTTLQQAGLRTVAVGRLALPMLADEAGHVDGVTSSVAAAARPGQVAGIVDPRLYDAPGTARPAARRAVDAHVARVERALPPGTTFMVAGIADLSAGHAVLHAFILDGPGWSHTELRSSAAGRAPYVQLIDIAPTIMSVAGVRIPSFVVGRPMQQAHTSVPPISSYVDDNHHAVLQRTLGQRVFLVLGLAAITMMVLAAGPLARGRGLARWLARLIAPAPALIFIGNALPWWRWGQWAYGLIVVGSCVVVAAATTAAARVGRHTLALVLPPAFAFVALSLDQLTGAHLQLSAPLGDSPLIAGRFSGMGNLDFAVLATSALVVAGIVAGRLARLAALLSAATLVLVAIVIDGAPPLGNDIGGVLALVPAGLVLLALVADVRFTRLRVLVVVVTTLVVAVGVALLDYTRPATDQTHVGRFVGQVLHGGAGTEVHRKLDASLASIGWTIGTFVVLFAIATAIVARHRILAALRGVPGGMAAGVSVVVVAVLGVALNDSGVVIAAMAAIVATSAFYGSEISAPPR